MMNTLKMSLLRVDVTFFRIDVQKVTLVTFKGGDSTPHEEYRGVNVTNVTFCHLAEGRCKGTGTSVWPTSHAEILTPAQHCGKMWLTMSKRKTQLF